MKSILIVEDDAATQHLLAALMRRNGFGSVIVADGAQALEAMASNDFAVIILDLMMPGVDGHSVIEYVAREKENIPVIVCTAAGPRSTDAIESKVVKAIIRKPFDIDHLTELVTKLAS